MSNYISIETSTLTLNNTVITGFSDDTDALAIPDVDIAVVKRGADGRMTATSTGNKGGPVTIKLLPTSKSVPFLSSLSEQQKNGSRVVISGSVVDHQNGSSVSLSNGSIATYTPFSPRGKGEVGNMNYIIEFERVDGNYESADLG